MGDPVLQNLIDEIERTRDLARTQRGQRGAGSAAQDTSRAEHLGALRSFAAALEARGVPVPRQVRDDIRLLEAISAPRYGRPQRP
ncbi:MAG: hypothetical protein ACJ72D_02265 [Marmoricola sp.]